MKVTPEGEYVCVAEGDRMLHFQSTCRSAVRPAVHRCIHRSSCLLLTDGEEEAPTLFCRALVEEGGGESACRSERESEERVGGEGEEEEL